MSLLRGYGRMDFSNAPGHKKTQPMKAKNLPPTRWALSGFFFVAILVWFLLPSGEPNYEGKKLSTWIDELQLLQPSEQANPKTPQVRAVRAIGTNAIPWLLKEIEMHPTGATWRWRVNQILNKQSLVRYRLPDPSHLMRAEVGFRALRELGEPAIPEVFALVVKQPHYVPMLAAIGPPAIPTLQNCLTNSGLETNQFGNRFIPANTISAVFWAGTVGSLTYQDIVIFIPSIKEWAAQSTNHSAQHNAAYVLDWLGLRE